ncbi:hypothetical protein Pmar_PMAR014926 [Perkinsus marinus ATCC 50983]|uniref:Uncharacterized protein n=1 Tax=Perkinsus marinus (strain ATCC 50983 / TXsc) TaxID=423536 RepID=C5L5A4_PERM5|nr:hypothetical protein Pmar_PMAR014926 [Perkinsus marinus ATCC 50983]EER08163.1 hypothetical protein Pmar_PMAR014926 [Perkinsus marinus ATCC 50983]|eukprot:XP_002776347.1 hypothetical protein Pmar_PMAR014926 [Perkinsus marinus ATCC 50983]
MQQQPPAPQGMSSQQMAAPSSAPQLMGPQMGMQYQQVPYPSATQQQSPQMMQTMPTMPSAYGMMDNTPMNTAPNPGMAASLQHQQRMQFVLANPNLLQDVAAMHQLKDTMSMAMEAPNATIQMDEQTRQNEQAAQFIRFMQSQISEMLTNPRVASNPELLQQLNTQMNQLRLITMQQVASEQLSTNPVTALSLATAPNSGAKTLTTDDIRSILESAMLDSESEDSEDDEDSEEGAGGSDDATEWWGDDIARKGGKGDMMQNEKHVSFGEGSPKKGCMKKGSDPSLSESNPFKEPEGEDETIPGDKKLRNSSRTLRKGRKTSRKSGSSDEKSLTKWMKQLMAAQSQLASYARLTDPSSLSCRIIC